MCDTVVVVRPDGVLFAKNSDRDPNEAQILDWQPRRNHASRAALRCTWIEIPQVGQTHAVLLSRPYWMWGAEMGVNEHGVAIGNEAVFTNQRYARSGLTGMDLVRLGLERSNSANQAAQVILALLDRYGQGGPCGLENSRLTYHNSFLIADPRRAFVLETAGKHWALEEVHSVRSISNGLTIPGFAERYRDRIRSRIAAGEARRCRTQDLAESAETPADMMRLLRDHGPPEPGRPAVVPRYSMLNGALGAPCVHAGGYVAATQTTASWVSRLRPEGSHHWATATAAPCCSLFKPVRIDQPLDVGFDAGSSYDPRVYWWRHERLHRLFDRDPELFGSIFLPQRDKIESRWRADPPEPGAAFAEALLLLEQWTAKLESTPAEDRRPGFVRRYWARRDRRAGLWE
jgi:dipeptidase